MLLTKYTEGRGPGTANDSGTGDRKMISVFHKRKPEGDRLDHLLA